MKPLQECFLYAFVDATYLQGRDPVALARALCDGGADVIQLRAKDWALERIRHVAEALVPVTRSAGVNLIVNDHPDVAVAVGAEGWHLGQEDFFGTGHGSMRELKPASGTWLAGLSTHAPDQARRALEAGPDYLAIGPVFATPTKPQTPAVTLEYVRWASQNVLIPWFAIGGINLDNLDRVMRAGARRVCVVSAILKAPNVTRTCHEFRRRLTSGLP